MTPFEKMEACQRAAVQSEASEVALDALSDTDWRVRYSAAVAAGDGKWPHAIGPLLAALAVEDAAPIYSQPETASFGTAGAPTASSPEFFMRTPTETLEAWKRRGRIKQAICLALGQIGKALPEVLDVLQRYAVDAGEDYTVRAAACHALGVLGSAASRSTLEAATRDEEWCTKTEARKAVQRLGT